MDNFYDVYRRVSAGAARIIERELESITPELGEFTPGEAYRLKDGVEGVVASIVEEWKPKKVNGDFPIVMPTFTVVDKLKYTVRHMNGENPKLKSYLNGLGLQLELLAESEALTGRH